MAEPNQRAHVDVVLRRVGQQKFVRVIAGHAEIGIEACFGRARALVSVALGQFDDLSQQGIVAHSCTRPSESMCAIQSSISAAPRSSTSWRPVSGIITPGSVARRR